MNEQTALLMLLGVVAGVLLSRITRQVMAARKRRTPNPPQRK